jgi:hypothetical protein
MPGIKHKRLQRYDPPEWAAQVKDLPKHYVQVNIMLFWGKCSNIQMIKGFLRFYRSVLL